ncbi:MAG: hypothetical protein VX278_10985 [Myxococcota bacterium]|nr:hypothetical protein [Myxococcota bacterium]
MMFLILVSCFAPRKSSVAQPPESVTAEISPPKQESKLDPQQQQEWPPVAWTHAKAYTYNFTSYGPGKKLRVWDEYGWADNIEQTFTLTQASADAALELIHQTQGDVQASKCPFPRHAVVYFNQKEEPVASINVCFSCTDILIYPPYFPSPEESFKRYETQSEEGGPLLFEIHERVLTKWESFFTDIGAERYEK